MLRVVEFIMKLEAHSCAIQDYSGNILECNMDTLLLLPLTTLQVGLLLLIFGRILKYTFIFHAVLLHSSIISSSGKWGGNTRILFVGS